jgi:hypothetical protein
LQALATRQRRTRLGRRQRRRQARRVRLRLEASTAGMAAAVQAMDARNSRQMGRLQQTRLVVVLLLVLVLAPRHLEHHGNEHCRRLTTNVSATATLRLAALEPAMSAVLLPLLRACCKAHKRY